MSAIVAAGAVAAIGASAQVTTGNPGSPAEVWSQANRDYRTGDMDGALRGYETLAERHDDPRLDADRAAALWRLGRRGEALASYREALALAPRNGVIRADAERLWVELDRPTRGGAVPRALGFVRLDELLAALLVASWLGAGAVAIARSRRRAAERRAARISAAVVVAVALLAALHAWTIERPDHAVAAAGAEVSATPGGEVIAALPEGALVQVLEREEDGWRVRAAGLPAGWVAPGLIVPLD
jgi:tetratricopeptide (TPR) repeat protein